MVGRLQDAFDQASRLPPDAQEQLADQLIEDIQGEMKWDALLEDSQETLDQMAAKALKARAEGKTRAGALINCEI